MAGGAPVSDCVQAGTEGWCSLSDFPKDNSTKSESSLAVWRDITRQSGHERQNRSASVVGVTHMSVCCKGKESDGDCGCKSHPSSILSRWWLPMKLPYWQEWMWLWMVMRNLSLNSKAQGNCSMSCHMHSSSWSMTGDTSLGSPTRWLHLWDEPPVRSKTF